MVDPRRPAGRADTKPGVYNTRGRFKALRNGSGRCSGPPLIIL